MAAISSAILVIVRQTKSIFELEQEFDGSNPYMKFGRNQIKKVSPLLGIKKITKLQLVKLQGE